MRLFPAFVLVIFVFTPAIAAAADYRLGYQLGLSQSMGTTIAPTGMLTPGETARTATITGAGTVAGLQLTTQATANMSIDVLTNSFDHGLIVGGGISQLLVPSAGQRLRTNIFSANLQYVTRLERPLYGLAFGAGYALTSNGRSCSAVNGAVDAICPRPDINNQAGTYIITGLAHQATGTGQLQLTRLRWDFNFQTNYTYSENAAYSLAPGPLGQQNLAVGGTNVGGFLRVRSHTVSPLAVYRQRVGNNGMFSAGALSTYTLQLDPADTTVMTGTVSTVVPGQLALPTTWNNSALLGYTQTLTQERAIGVEVNTSLNFRVATDPNTQEPFQNTGPTPDTLIAEAVVIYSDYLPWELRLNAEAGVAKPWLFQPPLGPRVPFNVEFQTVSGDPEIIGALSLQRFFDPITTTLSINRSITVGAFGVSAVINEQASLAATYQPELFERVAQLNVGFNVNQTRGVGRELFDMNAPGCDPSGLNGPLCTPQELLVLAFNNRGFGMNVAFGMPLFRAGDLAGTISATYNFNWLDPDPDNLVQTGTFTTHTALAMVALTFGRGPLARDGLGNRETDELDAFSQDPRSGSPLVTSRLLTQGAPMLEGTSTRRPGLPPEERRDSKQVYEQSRRQQQIEAESKKRADAVQGSGTVQDDDARAEEEATKEREERRKKRTRKFSEWPVDQMMLPEDQRTTTPTTTPEETPKP